MAFLQFVVGDLRAEVMDVMEADVAREPLQHFRQFVERTACHARLEEIPVLVALPIGRVEIMLDVEQPHARRAGDQQDGNFHQ